MQNGVDFGGWYMPNKEEWLEIYSKKAIINNVSIANGGSAFFEGDYWTSRETEGYSCPTAPRDAEVIHMGYGGTGRGTKFFLKRVRAIRAF